MTVEITGLSDVIMRMRRASVSAGRGCERALKQGGLLILRSSQKEVPVDLGNLKASGFSRKTSGKGFDAEIQVGYTADYGIFVHENPDALHGEDFNQEHAEEIALGLTHNRGKGQKSKFLEDPAKHHTRDILRMVEREVIKETKRI